MNFFSPRSAAERYSKGRYFFHPLVVGRVKEMLALDELLPRALDVGCGTGLSTVALQEVAREVVGVDASAEMLALARAAKGVRYVNAQAERLPFSDGAFDLVTLSQVFHWLDKAGFFAEARRVLREDGWLIVYDNYFAGRMEENADFHDTFHAAYLSKFPSPVRAWTNITEDDARGAGFQLLRHESLPTTTRFSPETLTGYLVTQSNVIAAVEVGGEDIGDVRRWLLERIEPLFGGAPEAAFLFRAPVWYLRRAASV